MIQMKLSGVRAVVKEEVGRPKTAEGMAVVRVRSVGICGSDMHVYLGENPVIRPENHVCGHEFGGTILDLPPGTTEWSTGDRVCVNPVVNCGRCHYCQNGMEHMCIDQHVIGGDVDGAMCEEIAVPIHNLVRLPADFDMSLAALIEPVAVAVHSSEAIHDSNVLVIGLGTIGLLTVQVCKLNRNRVIAIDVRDRFFDLARKLGAEATVLADELDPKGIGKRYLGGGLLDWVVDNVNVRATVDLAVNAVRRCGQIVLVGIPHGNFEADILGLLLNELKVSTSYLYTDDDFRTAADLVATGKIDVSSLVTRRFALEDARAAFEHKLSADAIKVLLEP